LVGCVNQYRESHRVAYESFGKPDLGLKLAEEITPEEFSRITEFQTLKTKITEIIK